MHFEEFMFIATSTELAINANTRHHYFIGLSALKMMMCILSNESDREAKSVYLDAMEARVHFQHDVTIEHANTITDYQD